MKIHWTLRLPHGHIWIRDTCNINQLSTTMSLTKVTLETRLQVQHKQLRSLSLGLNFQNHMIVVFKSLALTHLPYVFHQWRPSKLPVLTAPSWWAWEVKSEPSSINRKLKSEICTYNQWEIKFRHLISIFNLVHRNWKQLLKCNKLQESQSQCLETQGLFAWKFMISEHNRYQQNHLAQQRISSSPSDS